MEVPQNITEIKVTDGESYPEGPECRSCLHLHPGSPDVLCPVACFVLLEFSINGVLCPFAGHDLEMHLRPVCTESTTVHRGRSRSARMQRFVQSPADGHAGASGVGPFQVKPPRTFTYRLCAEWDFRLLQSMRVTFREPPSCSPKPVCFLMFPAAVHGAPAPRPPIQLSGGLRYGLPEAPVRPSRAVPGVCSCTYFPSTCLLW